MKKKIAVLGATGSIGTTALNIIRNHKDKYDVVLLANNSNKEGLDALIEEFKPAYAYCKKHKFLYDKKGQLKFQENFIFNSEIYNNIDIVINGIDGIDGLAPSIAALTAGVTLATANKESFVSAGRFMNLTKEKYGGVIIPLDSEHSTLWQCMGEDKENIDSLILTASGGAFRKWSKPELQKAKALDALKHPNWVMGKKVTIDCATLMNKGMEIIEAKYLFGINNIEVVQHNQSVVHGMVRFKDGSVIAGLSMPDMTLPIQYALTHPKRQLSAVQPLDFSKITKLDFSDIDEDKFPCFKIAKKVFKMKETASTIMNASNEAAVYAYLDNKIGFYDIPKLIDNALKKFYNKKDLQDLSQVYSIHNDVYEYTCKRIQTGDYK